MPIPPPPTFAAWLHAQTWAALWLWTAGSAVVLVVFGWAILAPLSPAEREALADREGREW